MMKTNIVRKEALRKVQIDTFKTLRDALVCSYGPNGSYTNIDRTTAFNNYSKDGYTILSSIQFMGRIESAIKEDLENLTRHTNYIKQNSYRLLRLVNNLIDINKMDMGAYELRCSNNNIVSIIEDITLSVSDYIQNNKINLIFDTNTEEVITYCDPDKIERIMLNLLSNAIKYTEDNGLIEVNIDANEYEIVVSVKDTGIGIPKEKLEFIFPFHCWKKKTNNLDSIILISR